MASRTVPGLLLMAALALTACTSERADDAPTPSTSSTTPTSPSSTPPAVTTPAQLATAMHAGVDGLTSASVAFSGTYRGNGSVTYEDGRLRDLETSGPAVSETYSAERLVISSGAVYVRAEDLDGTAAGQWERAGPTSTTPIGQKAAVSAAAVYALLDVGPLADVFGAATSLTEVGVVTGGTRYDLPAFAPSARLSSLFGAAAVPVRAYVDLAPDGRPVRASAQLTIGGEYRVVAVEWSDFDEPVTIEVPSADETAGG